MKFLSLKLASLMIVNTVLFAGLGWRAYQALSAGSAAAHLSARIGQQQARLQVGDQAPNFRLMQLNGKETAQLLDGEEGKPTIIIFGSYSCPLFRKAAAPVDTLYTRYRDRANFRMVYIREAHPFETQHHPANIDLPPIPTAKSLGDRRAAAEVCAGAIGLTMPILVDRLDDAAAEAYSAWPERVVLVGRDGCIRLLSTASSIDVEGIERKLYQELR